MSQDNINKRHKNNRLLPYDSCITQRPLNSGTSIEKFFGNFYSKSLNNTIKTLYFTDVLHG